MKITVLLCTEAPDQCDDADADMEPQSTLPALSPLSRRLEEETPVLSDSRGESEGSCAEARPSVSIAGHTSNVDNALLVNHDTYSDCHLIRCYPFLKASIAVLNDSDSDPLRKPQRISFANATKRHPDRQISSPLHRPHSIKPRLPSMSPAPDPMWAVHRIVASYRRWGETFYKVCSEPTREPAESLRGCADRTIEGFQHVQD